MFGMQVTVARYTNAYGTFLTLFTLIYMAIVSVLRAADMMAGLVLGILGAIIVVIGQFIWPAHLLWAGVRTSCSFTAQDDNDSLEMNSTCA